MVPPPVVQVTPALVVPVTVALNCCVPPVASDTDWGEIDTKTETGAVTLKAREFVLVPVLVFFTVTVSVPAAVKSADGTVALALLLLHTVVGSDCPFHCTTHLPLKPDPLMVRVNVGLPATAWDGDMLVRVNDGAPELGTTTVITAMARKRKDSGPDLRGERFTGPPRLASDHIHQTESPSALGLQPKSRSREAPDAECSPVALFVVHKMPVRGTTRAR